MKKAGLEKVALGGGCHWCTEAVFQSLKGVAEVDQGWVASEAGNSIFSEAVVVTFGTSIITLQDLIEVHLYTHRSTSAHSMRDKYRSAIYYFSEAQKEDSLQILDLLQTDFEEQIITKVIPFKGFRPSRDEITNYYYNNPQKPFCERYIAPKLQLLLQKFWPLVSTSIEKSMHA